MLNKVIGQDRAKKTLELLGHGYKRRGIIPPLGIFGGSGLGKTHLVSSWAKEIGAKLIYVNGTSVKDALAFREFFREAYNNQSNYYIIFIDECHGLPKKVQDNLLSVLEEPAVLCTIAPKDMGLVWCVDGRRYIEKGNIMREALPKNMSFVLATTDPAQLKEAILNRLRKISLSPYTINDKIQIAMMHLVEHGTCSDQVVCRALANRSRSIRHLKSELCETFIDIRSLYGDDNNEALSTLDDMLGIDEDGANDQDKDYMEYLSENKTVGLETMAGKLRIDKLEILKHVEPFLIGKGWVQVTGRGRRLTEAGFKKILGDNYANPAV
ncbi:MAG: Holliday junction DNA helicase RuvB C-terminal domain-containing protein [Candidatus Thorarchaeota archaeon]|jgi:Holliday junction DNA helicase RuvB